SRHPVSRAAPAPTPPTEPTEPTERPNRGGRTMTERWDYELYIDGAWTSEGAVGTIDVIDPATEASVGSVPEASPKTAVEAITAARRAFDTGPWPWMKPA